MQAPLKMQTATKSPLSKKDILYYTNALIGITIMLGFRFLPPLDPITPLGMEVLGVFIGVIYLWTTCDSVWPSLLGVFVLGCGNIAPMNEVLLKFLGDATVVQTIFMMIFTGALIQLGITTYIARWFLTRQIINGRPWFFTFIILLGAYLISAFAAPFAGIFLFWPILYGIFKEVGIKPGEKYASLSIIAIVMVALFGFATAPYKDVPLMLISNYNMLSATPLNEASYITLTIALSICGILGVIGVMRFIFKCDVSKIKDINVEMFKKSHLPPMNTSQKFISISFVIYVIIMLLPGILPKDLALTIFLNQTKFAINILFLAVLCGLKSEGKPMIDFQVVASTQIKWGTILLIAAALVIGNYVTAEVTGISPFLKQTFTPIFENQTTLSFTILILILALILTNFSNSAVIGMIFLPIILTFTPILNIPSEPISALFIYLVLIAAITPAASPFAALTHGNKEWLDTQEIYKYATVFSVATLLITLFIGIPLANLLF